MRVFAIALAFGALATGVSHAQAPAPGAPAPRPAAPAQTAPKPAGPPVIPGPAAPAPQFKDGFKYAYVYMQRVAAESAEGKAAAERLKTAQDSKQRELQDKNKNLQAMQQKLDSGGSVLSEAARTQLTSDIDRTQRDLQRASEDAQQDLQKLAEQVEEDFNRRVIPVIDRVAKEKQVHFVFNASQSGLIWADPGMDLTTEVIAAINTAPAKTAAPAAAPPAAAPPAPTTPR